MGDRARRNNLVLNPVCEEKWLARCHEKHRERLSHIKPMVNTSEPTCIKMSHVNAHANPKKLEQKAERQKNIDKDNKVLLEKMLKIHSSDSQQTIRPFLARTTFRWGHGQYFDPITGTRCLDHINTNPCPSPPLYSSAASMYSSPVGWHSASNSRGPSTPTRAQSTGCSRENNMLLHAMNLETGHNARSLSLNDYDPNTVTNSALNLSPMHGHLGPGTPYVAPPSPKSPKRSPVKRTLSARSLHASSASPTNALNSAPMSPVSPTTRRAFPPSSPRSLAGATQAASSLYSPLLGTRPSGGRSSGEMEPDSLPPLFGADDERQRSCSSPRAGPLSRGGSVSRLSGSQQPPLAQGRPAAAAAGDVEEDDEI